MLIARSSGGCARRARRSVGFTLIELMVAVTVIAVSLALAAPSFSQMISNYRVRSGAEAVLNGLNYARTEAVRRNTAVSFTLAGTSSAWSVAEVSSGTVLQSRSGGDSHGVSAASSNGSSSVTFLPTGLIDTTGTWMTQIAVSSSTTATDARQINVFGGGLIRMCDPNVSTINDSRRC